jgi:hypothetical protein
LDVNFVWISIENLVLYFSPVCCEKLESVTTCLLSRSRVSSQPQCFGSGVKDPVLSVVVPFGLRPSFLSGGLETSSCSLSHALDLRHRHSFPSASSRSSAWFTCCCHQLASSCRSQFCFWVHEFWSFVPISSSRRPDFVFLWLDVACSLVLLCRKTVPLVPLPAGCCASRSSVSVVA